MLLFPALELTLKTASLWSVIVVVLAEATVLESFFFSLSPSHSHSLSLSNIFILILILKI